MFPTIPLLRVYNPLIHPPKTSNRGRQVKKVNPFLNSPTLIFCFKGNVENRKESVKIFKYFITFYDFLFSACPAGTWGPSCENKCPCMNGASCDPMSGACTCPPGWRGDKCQTTCDPYRLVSSPFSILYAREKENKVAGSFVFSQ